MRKETREALERSITHWEENLTMARTGRGTALNIGASNCALCQMFYSKCYSKCYMAGDSKEKCPVFEKIGVPGCHSTPYSDVTEALDDLHTISNTYNSSEEEVEDATNTLIDSIKIELSFLKSLREDTE